ncbi:MAG: cell division protein CrgA [Actinobacteria bacterium]|nr:cell division protein CrgA [Actinomycetota bacterium]MCL6104293.1 cell division protein CrgA [Actinomycetota bacterium]
MTPRRHNLRGGRVTPKKSQQQEQEYLTGRYTPPIPKRLKTSPLWIPILMFAALGIGILMIITNYLGILPGGTSGWYLLGGLALLAIGFFTATRYR